MTYPGDGYKLSNYGHKTYTPEQAKEQWRESCAREQTISKFHAVSKKKGEAGAESPEKSEENYFNTRKTHAAVSSYDRGFHIEEGYSSKLKRDDLQHTQGLNVLAEEEGKAVPVLANSVYGHRQPLETPDREHARVGLVRREFYRATGTNIGPGLH